MLWFDVLIGWQEFEQYGVRQSFEKLRNSEADASYILFHPKFIKRYILSITLI